MLLCTTGHWATQTNSVVPIVSLSHVIADLNFDQLIRRELTEREVWQRGCWQGWVCFCYWLNAARAPTVPAATRISCCRHVHSHSGVDIRASLKTQKSVLQLGLFKSTAQQSVTVPVLFPGPNFFDHPTVKCWSQIRYKIHPARLFYLPSTSMWRIFNLLSARPISSSSQ